MKRCSTRQSPTTLAAIANRVAEEAPPYAAVHPPRPTPSPRQKLVLFTEHRDTLNYLEQRITTLLGRREAVVCIHGGVVALVTTAYHTGVTLTKETMGTVEAQISRLPHLGKWFVDIICPPAARWDT